MRARRVKIAKGYGPYPISLVVADKHVFYGELRHAIRARWSFGMVFADRRCSSSPYTAALDERLSYRL